jgi:hypothetical protein
VHEHRRIPILSASSTASKAVPDGVFQRPDHCSRLLREVVVEPFGRLWQAQPDDAIEPINR